MLPVDTTWFDENPQKYLQRPEFIRFQEVANVDFMDLKSSNSETLYQVQKQLCSKSIALNELRKEHSGYGMPFIAYTHDLGFGDKLPKHQEELDNIIMGGNLFDSRAAAISPFPILFYHSKSANLRQSLELRSKLQISVPGSALI